MKNNEQSVSVIIPVYNEESVIADCLESLTKQTLKPKEIIIVDDGSIDNSKIKVSAFANPPAGRTGATADKQNSKVIRLEQEHQGPGMARNLGAKHATGDILVFVDSDMTFAPDFVDKLAKPIRLGKAKGTFTKEEYVANWDNIWARCWNYNEGLRDNQRVPADYPSTAPVFRAILRDEFKRVGGFDDIGFTDDWTLSRKLNYEASAAPGAVCYHRNPASLGEIYNQARWIGKNEFITGTIERKFFNALRYNPIYQILRGLFLALLYQEPACVPFSLFYSLGIEVSIFGSFIGESKNK